MQNKPNIQYLDSLRTLAMLGVIVIHISSPLVNMTWGKNMPYWWIGNVVDSAVRFSVPLFLMLSGATLLGKDYELSEFYKRRFSRVMIPFLFWIVIYWMYRWATLSAKLQPHDFHTILSWAGNLFLKEGVSKHFWYVYMILFIYLFVPFLGKFTRKISMSVFSNILLIWVILTFVLRSSSFNLYSWSGDYGSKFLAYFLFSGYLLLGYYLYKLATNPVKLRPLAAMLFVFSIAISAVATFLFSMKAHKLDLTMYGYLSVNTMIQSIALFLWIKDSIIKNRFISLINSQISNYSYGIYLVHILVISLLFDRGIYWKFTNPLLSLPLLTLAVLIISFGIIFVLRKIPFGKYISG